MEVIVDVLEVVDMVKVEVIGDSVVDMVFD